LDDLVFVVWRVARVLLGLVDSPVHRHGSWFRVWGRCIPVPVCARARTRMMRGNNHEMLAMFMHAGGCVELG
jgi:hypothetical protein